MFKISSVCDKFKGDIRDIFKHTNLEYFLIQRLTHLYCEEGISFSVLSFL